MFQSYLKDFGKENNSFQSNFQELSLQNNSFKQEGVWDEVIDRHLENFAVEYQFDFEKVAAKLSGVIGDKYQQTINNESCRKRWQQLHSKPIEDNGNDRLDRVSKNGMKMEEPTYTLTVSEMVDKLPKTRQNKDFLKISDSEKLQSYYVNDKGEKIQPTTYNVLKGTAMGIKDKTERERAFKKQQDEFFKNLENLKGDQDQEMFEKPLIAKFTEPTSFVVEKEELTKEQAQKIMQMKNIGSAPLKSEMGYKMDNYASRFARQGEEEEEIKKDEQEKLKAMNQELMYGQIETYGEIQRDQAAQKNQMNMTEEEKIKQKNIDEQKRKINASLYQADRGLKNTDESDNSQEKIRQKPKVNNYFEDEEKRIQQQNIQLQPNKSPIHKSEEQIRQDIIKQSLANIKQQDEKNIELERKQEQMKKTPKLRAFSQFNEDRDESENENEIYEAELDNELYIQAQRLGLKSDEEIDNYINKKKEERMSSQSNKRPSFSKIPEYKPAQEDPEKILAKQEREILLKQQYLEKFLKKKEEQNGQFEEQLKNSSNHWRELGEYEFSAGIAFKRQLEEEKISRMIKEQFEEMYTRVIDYEINKQIQEEYNIKKIDIENKPIRREPIYDENETNEMMEEYLESRQRLKEEIEKNIEKAEQQEEYEQDKFIKQKNSFYESKIKNFQTNDPFKCYFDEHVNHLKSISSLPEKLNSKITDLKQYDHSKEGKNSRYQILVFPYLERCQEFSLQFLGFFLRNSFFRQPPTEQELGDTMSKDSKKENPNQEQNGFPYCLVSFFIGSSTDAISDEQEDQRLSTYLSDKQTFDKLISEGQFKKCIYLFFDTNLSRGQKTLSKQLDLSLKDILSERSIDSAVREYGDSIIKKNMKLNEFKFAYHKNMELTQKLFNEINTFHSICPTKTSYHQTSQLNRLSSKKNIHCASPSSSPSVGNHSHNNQQETSVIIIRQYSEIQQPIGLSEKQNRIGDLSSTIAIQLKQGTTEQVSNFSEANSSKIPTQTEISEKQKSQMTTDVLNYTLNRLYQKGIQVLGMKTFYFNDQNKYEFKNYVENVHFSPNSNQPVVVIAVAGCDLHAKLKKMVGSEDAQLAKRLEPNSLNALFATGREDSIIVPYNKIISRRLISYFFTGKIQKLQTLQEIYQAEGLTNKKSSKTKTFNPVFLLNSQPVQEHICILSSKFQPNNFNQIIRKIQTRGFEIINIRVIDNANLSSIMKRDKEFSTFINKQGLQELNVGENGQERINLVLHISGVNISSLRDVLLEKVIDYNPFLHPNKHEIFYYTNDETQLHLLQDVLFKHNVKSNFTPSNSFPLYIALWPFLNDYESENMTASQAVPLGDDIKIFTSYGLELLTVSKIYQSQVAYKPNVSVDSEDAIDLRSLLQQLLQNNINVNTITKKKQEFGTFCGRLTDEILQQDFYLAVFRFQGDKQSKHIDRLFTEAPFVHSNKTINESTVVAHGVKQTQIAQTNPLPSEFLSLFFLDANSHQVQSLTHLLGVGVFDDWSFKGSFIYDLPSSGYTGELETIIILSEEVVKTLLLAGLVKLIENNQFKIKSFFKYRCSRELSDVIYENLLTIYQTQDTQIHDQGTKLQNVKASFDNLISKLQGESMYFLILSKENGIFNGKKMLFELAQKYAVFKKETIKPDSATEYMLDKGMYCSLNYKCQQREFKELSYINSQILSMANLDTQSVQKEYENQVVMILRIDQQVQLYEIFRKLSTDLKFKILNFLVLSQFQQAEVSYFSTLFTPKYDSQHIQKYFEINNDGIYCILHLDSKNAVNISDAFGTHRLNEKGEFQQVISSSLFGKQEAFFIYANNPSHVQKLSAYAFKSSE